MATLQEAEALLGSEYLTGLYDTFLAQTGNAELAAQSVQAAISGFAAETGPGGAPQPSGQAQMGGKRSQSDILADLQAGRLTRDQAIQEFLGLGVPYSQAVLSVDTVLGVGEKKDGKSGVPGPEVKTVSPLTPNAQRELAFRSQTQDPEQAFRNVFDTSKEAIDPFGDFVREHLTSTASRAGPLTAFLRPNVPEADIQNLSMGKFLGSGVGANDSILGGVPSSFHLNRALMEAALPPSGGFTNKAQQSQSDFLRQSGQNEGVFNIAAMPFVEQAAPWAQNALKRYLFRTFNQFQGTTPETSFLGALSGGFSPWGKLIPGLNQVGGGFIPQSGF